MKSGYFVSAAGPRRQWQHRREQQERRDARRLRLLSLVGDSLPNRLAGQYRGGLAPPGGRRGPWKDLESALFGPPGPSQAELAEQLTREGHPCSQATVSRDLEWLGEWLRQDWSDWGIEIYGPRLYDERPLTPLEQQAGHPCRTWKERMDAIGRWLRTPSRHGAKR